MPLGSRSGPAGSLCSLSWKNFLVTGKSASVLGPCSGSCLQEWFGMEFQENSGGSSNLRRLVSRWKPPPPATLQEHAPDDAPRSSVPSRIKTVFKGPQSPSCPPGPRLDLYSCLKQASEKCGGRSRSSDSMSAHGAAAVADLGCGGLRFPSAEFLPDLLRGIHGHPVSLPHRALVLGWQADRVISDASAY